MGSGHCAVVTSWFLFLQSDLSLNIREAHAFNTNDGFSLDVFVVDQIADQVREYFHFKLNVRRIIEIR